MVANEHLIQILQASVAPCVLISGAGLLLLSITNRLGRPIDRVRSLCAELKKAPADEAVAIREQIKIFYQRCQLLRAAITFTVCGLIAASMMVLAIFTSFFLTIQSTIVIYALFNISLLCIILSLIYFLLDIRVTLNSLKIEIRKSGIVI